jgi:selenocysteine lyase/cysteine desulfurase
LRRVDVWREHAHGVQALSTATHKWKVLLDAAAFVPTRPLDLTATPADFVTVSFYKMLGYPTGLGALLVRLCSVLVVTNHAV